VGGGYRPAGTPAARPPRWAKVASGFGLARDGDRTPPGGLAGLGVER
jgi:hypothetical protein